MKILYKIGILLYTLFIYVFLPLLGWGLDEFRSFFGYPQLLVYTISIALTGFLVGWKIKQPSELGDRGKGQADTAFPVMGWNSAHDPVSGDCSFSHPG